MADIEKVGLLAKVDGRILLVRKKRLSALILPGGRLEPGETEVECLHREVREELGPDAVVEQLTRIGSYEDVAASDDPAQKLTVRIALYAGVLTGDIVASSEIVELVWFDPNPNTATVRPTELSPILKNKIVPDLVARGIINWS